MADGYSDVVVTNGNVEMVNAYAKPEAFNKMLAGKAGLQLEMLHVKSLKLKIPWFNWSASPQPCVAALLRLCPCTSAPLHLCTAAPLHLGTAAPMHLCRSAGVDIELDSLLVVVRPLASDHWTLEKVPRLLVT